MSSSLPANWRILLALALFGLAGCATSPQRVADKPLLRPQSESQSIKVEQTSDDVICVTVAGERTCVPVVHDQEQ